MARDDMFMSYMQCFIIRNVAPVFWALVCNLTVLQSVSFELAVDLQLSFASFAYSQCDMCIWHTVKSLI